MIDLEEYEGKLPQEGDRRINEGIGARVATASMKEIKMRT